MSRVGKKPIKIPEGVEVNIEGQRVTIKGPKGSLQIEVRPEIKVEKKEKQILVSPQVETKKTKAFWGLFRSLIFNMIQGVKEGFEKKLEVIGLGYKARLEGEDLVLEVGFSHPVKIKAPEGIKFTVEKNTITVSGIDKQLVGQIAAKIRHVKPPEPYKGTGIRYLGEKIRKKAGKKVVTAGQ
ncbi:50S ribosomal protein L6 [bacterium]|nr:50S ribosomal protein L6 [bacterium]